MALTQVQQGMVGTQTSIPMTYGAIGSGNSSIMKNRIINGAMVIDQRNAGASYTVPGGGSSPYYTIDRWSIQSIGSNVFTTQQSSTAPVGFSTSLKITVASAQTIGSSDYYMLQQGIEGYNIADLNWGTANAKTVTLSFWAYSSLTGTFSGSLRNSDASRSYAFTYSIVSANTWTYCTVTIAGDTSGTWQTTNSTGIILGFDLGSGSARKSTAGSWQASNLYGVTGSVTLASNASAILYLDGVQLEVGSSATGFEYVNYQTSLANCYRYYYYLGGDTAYQSINTVSWYSAGDAVGYFAYPVTMRSAPSISKTGTWTTLGGSGAAGQNISGDQVGPKTAQLGCTSGSGGISGQASTLRVSNDLNFRLAFSAEL